jgi:peptide-methionine (S)-S-oxide reductase
VCRSGLPGIKAEKCKTKLDASGIFDAPIVTTIEPVFYPAENYHSNYYKRNPSQSYCYHVIRPKMEKFKKIFGDKIKPGK